MATEKIGVLAFVPERWSTRWQVRHHVLTRLARHFPVVWVNPPHEWREAFTATEVDQQAPGAGEFPGFSVYSAPWWLPKIYRPNAAGMITSRVRLRQARSRLKALGCQKIVLYLWRPEYAFALDQVDHDLSCYHIDDEYSFSSEEKELDPTEVDLIRSVDLVLIHSPELLKKKGHVNPRTEFSPLGVDFDEFAREYPEPADLKTITRPRIGYAGFIKDTLDLELILLLCQRHPEWSFVFVGAVRLDQHVDDILARLKSQPNFHALGSKPTEQLREYPQHFDVCIMPYRHNGYTKFGSPLKLHEYLATGKPTVGTPIPSLRPFHEVVTLVDGLNAWEQAISSGLAKEAVSAARVEQRKRVAKQYDWTILVEKIALSIEQTLRDQVS